MYPGLVNCTTIDWFHTWPAEALLCSDYLDPIASCILSSLSSPIPPPPPPPPLPLPPPQFLAQVEFSDDSYRLKISAVFAEMHLSVISSSTRMV
jgi:hypothetical protein